MILRPTIERLVLTGGGRPGKTKVEAQIAFVVNDDNATLTLECVIDVHDDPPFSVMQERVFQALQGAQPPIVPTS